jgi:uncharacterized repeat protein (TIGR03847 family)
VVRFPRYPGSFPRAPSCETLSPGTVTAVARSIDLDPVDGIGVGTTGPPGRRQFFLRASGGAETIVLNCEKFHVQGLVTRMRQMLEAHGLGPPPAEIQAPAAEPAEPEWTVGQLGLGYHENRRLFVIVAQQAGDADDDPGSLATARFWATPEQVLAFTRQAEGVLASGRATCSHCGLPIDPSGHPCPAGNGSRPIL